MKISIVIPTLNAARDLSATLAALEPAREGLVQETPARDAPMRNPMRDALIREVIVVDGGSADGTPDLATAARARVLTSPCGRGQQLRAGIAAARAKWLLLLHADTRLDPGWRDAALEHMRDHPGAAGYFRFALDSPDPRARRLERLVAWRCRVLGLPYGDQGLLINRDTLEAAGGMRPLPLMEDVELIRRLRSRRLHIRLLNARAVTSAGKWERDGWYRRSARNLVCLSLWFLGVPPSRIARLYESRIARPEGCPRG